MILRLTSILTRAAGYSGILTHVSRICFLTAVAFGILNGIWHEFHLVDAGDDGQDDE